MCACGRHLHVSEQKAHASKWLVSSGRRHSGGTNSPPLIIINQRRATRGASISMSSQRKCTLLLLNLAAQRAVKFSSSRFSQLTNIFLPLNNKPVLQQSSSHRHHQQEDGPPQTAAAVAAAVGPSGLAEEANGGSPETGLRVADDFAPLNWPAILRCRLVVAPESDNTDNANGGERQQAGSAGAAADQQEARWRQQSHYKLLEWFTSDGIQISAGEVNKGNKFTAFETGELHLRSTEMADFRRTYGCRMRNSLTQRTLSSSGLAQLILAPSPPSASNNEQVVATNSPQVLHSQPNGRLVALDWSSTAAAAAAAVAAVASIGQHRGPSYRYASSPGLPRPPFGLHQWPHASESGESMAAPVVQSEGRFLLIPCALRAPLSVVAERGRWLYQAAHFGVRHAHMAISEAVAAAATSGPIPLEQWASLARVPLVSWTVPLAQGSENTGSGGKVADNSPSNQPHNYPNRQSRLIASPTYLAIEWPRESLSGRYIFQLTTTNSNNNESARKTMCDINVIIRRPIKLRIEPLAPSGSDRAAPFGAEDEGDEGVAGGAVAAAQQAGQQGAADEPPTKGWLPNWLLPDWWMSAATRGSGQIGGGRWRRATNAANQRTGGGGGGGPLNSLLDEDASRIQARGPGLVGVTPIVRVGQQLHLQCLGSGSPIELVRWFRNGQPIDTQSAQDFQTQIMHHHHHHQHYYQRMQNKEKEDENGQMAEANQHRHLFGNGQDDKEALSGAAGNGERVLSSLLVPQLQARHAGLQMFECFAQNSHDDRQRTALPVYVADRALLEWARQSARRCPLAMGGPPLELQEAADALTGAGAATEGNGGDISGEAWPAMGESTAPAARSAFRRLNPLATALAIEGEPLELVCPLASAAADAAATLSSRQSQVAPPFAAAPMAGRVEWLKWTEQTRASDKQQPMDKATAGAHFRNFNQLFGGDSRFVINGSSLQIRSPSARHDQSLYVCRHQTQAQQRQPGASAAGALAVAAANGGSPQQQQQPLGGVHQSSLAAAAATATASLLPPGLCFESAVATTESASATATASGGGATLGQSPYAELQPSVSSISIQIVAKPKIDPFEFSRNLEEGMRSVVVCAVVSGQSPVDITWFKDGELLLESDEIRLDQSTGFSSSLTFHRIRPAHSGHYTCIAANALGATNHTSRLLVNVAPYFIEPPRSQRAFLNSNVLINCRAAGQPSPQIRWRKLVSVASKVAPSLGDKPSDSQQGGGVDSISGGGGAIGEQLAAAATTSSGSQQVARQEFRIIASNSHIQILENGSMIIRDLEFADASRYACQASNGINPSLSEVIDLFVLTPAQFDVNFESVSVKRDALVKFSCAPRGDQPMQIEWLKEGAPLVPVETLFSSFPSPFNGASEAPLNLSSVAGAATSRSSSSSSQQLHKYSETVHLAPQNGSSLPFGSNGNANGISSDQQASPRQRHSKLVLAKQRLINSSSSSSPPPPSEHHHQRPPAETRLLGGGINGDPQPTTTINSQPQPQMEGALWSELHIQSADRDDSATFVCVARNAYGRDELTYRLLVQEPPDAPLDLQLSQVQATSARLTWTAPFDGHLPLTHYVIEHRKLQHPKGRTSGVYSSEQWSRMIVGSNKLLQQTAPSEESLHATSTSLGHHQMSSASSSSSSSGGDNSGTVSQVANGGGKQFGVTLKQLEPRSAYQIRVAAVNALAQGAFSQVASLLTAEEPPNVRPNDLRAQPISSSAIKVMWRGPSLPDEQAPVRGYYVSHRRFDPQQQQQQQQSAQQQAATQQQQQLQAWLATTSVGAANSTSTSSSSSSALLSSSFSSTSAAVNNENEAREQQVAIGGAPNYELILQMLEKNAKYEIRVQPYNSMGVGPASDTMGQTLKFDKPGQPQLVLVAARRQSFELKWSVPGDEPLQGFSLFYKCEFDDWQEIQLALVYHYVIESLRCGNKYQIYLSAFNVVGRSEPSDVLSARTEGTVPIAPEKTNFLQLNSTEVVLDMSRWQTGGCPISSFMVQFKRLHDSSWFALSEGPAPFSQSDKITLPNLTPATWYKLLVTALNEAGTTNAEFVFATLTADGQQLAAANWNHPLAGGHLHESGSGGLLAYIGSLLFPGSSMSAAPMASSNAGGGGVSYQQQQHQQHHAHLGQPGDAQLLLPTSCVLLLLVTLLASYLYYSRGGDRKQGQRQNLTGGGGGGGGKSADRHEQQQQLSGCHTMNRAPSLLMIDRLNCAAGDSSSSSAGSMQQQHLLLLRNRAQDEKRLILTGGPCDQHAQTLHLRHHAAGAGSMLDSFLAHQTATATATATATTADHHHHQPQRPQQQQVGTLKLVAASAANCFADGASSQASSSGLGSGTGSVGGGPPSGARLQLIDEQRSINGNCNFGLSLGGHIHHQEQQQQQHQQTQQPQQQVYAPPTSGSEGNFSPNRTLYATTTVPQHVDLLAGGDHFEQPLAGDEHNFGGRSLLAGGNLFEAAVAEQRARSQLYGSAASQRLLSSSFASAADLLRRQQQIYQCHQREEEQQQSHQCELQEEPIYQRLEKFKACGLATCKRFATLGPRSQTLRPTVHFQQQQQQQQQQFSLDDQMGLNLLDNNQSTADSAGSFFPPPPPPAIANFESLENGHEQHELSEQQQQQQQQVNYTPPPASFNY